MTPPAISRWSCRYGWWTNILILDTATSSKAAGMSEHDELDSATLPAEDSGGFVAVAILAAALGAGAAVLLAPDEGSRTRKRMRSGLRSLKGDAAARVAQLQREMKRRKNQSRREKRMIALAGVLVGAGLAALMTPRGADVRTRLGSTLSRIKVGAIERSFGGSAKGSKRSGARKRPEHGLLTSSASAAPWR